MSRVRVNKHVRLERLKNTIYDLDMFKKICIHVYM